MKSRKQSMRPLPAFIAPTLAVIAVIFLIAATFVAGNPIAVACFVLGIVAALAAISIAVSNRTLHREEELSLVV